MMCDHGDLTRQIEQLLPNVKRDHGDLMLCPAAAARGGVRPWRPYLVHRTAAAQLECELGNLFQCRAVAALCAARPRQPNLASSSCHPTSRVTTVT
ncbi:hypothetical protein MRX96_057195 [Rhipicephalus microplus]